MSRRLTLRRDRSTGQSLVEFALVLPMIVFLLMGVLDFGRGVFAFNTLAESARQANRLAIVDQDIGRVRTVAIDHAPALGLAPGDVDVCFSESLANPPSCGAAPCLGCLAIVTSTTTFTPITPVISVLWPSIDLSSTSVGSIENVCPRPGRLTCP